MANTNVLMTRVNPPVELLTQYNDVLGMAPFPGPISHLWTSEVLLGASVLVTHVDDDLPPVEAFVLPL